MFTPAHTPNHVNQTFWGHHSLKDLRGRNAETWFEFVYFIILLV